MENIKKYKWILVVVCCLIVVFAPIKFPNNVSAFVKILPSKELVALKGSNGQIITHIVNNFTGIVEDVNTIQVDREDFASLKLIIKNSDVLKGDTVAVFTSSHTNFIVEETKGQISENEKLLNSQQSGEKSSIIAEQEKIYEMSKISYANQESIFNRAASLYNSKLISVEEYDLAKNLLAKLKLDEEKEYQNLLSLKSGLKAEDISITRDKINYLNNQMKILKNRVSDYNICTPFNGFVSGISSLDTLFTISEINSYVVFIPIELEKSNLVKIGQNVIFEVSNKKFNIPIQKMDSQIQLINGKKYVVYKSQLKTDEKLFSSIYNCSIVGENLTILTILINKFNSIFNF